MEYIIHTSMGNMTIGGFYKWKAHTVRTEAYAEVWTFSKIVLFLVVFLLFSQINPSHVLTRRNNSSAGAAELSSFSKQFCNITVKTLLGCNKQLSNL